VFVDWAWTCLRQRRFAALLLAGAAFAGLTAWCWPASDPYNERNRNTSLMMQLVKAGNFEHALRYSDVVLQDVQAGADDENDLAEWRVKSLLEGTAAMRRALEAPAGGARRELELARTYTSLMQVTKRGEREELESLALDAYSKALELEPNIEGARHGIGLVHAAQNDLRRALVAFREELRRHPENGKAHRDTAMILLNWGGHDAAAIEHLEEALAAGVEEGPILAYAARLHVDPRLAALRPLEVHGEPIAMLDHARARRYAERALELDPDDNIVREQCSYALYALGDVDRSIELLEALMQDQPWRKDELQHRIDKLREGAAAKKSE
jgi:tetratricopeptide (TPR) repeat protein